MAYYKIYKNGKAIDVLDKLTFVKYNEKRRCMVLSPVESAQGIVSPEGVYWHLKGFYNFPIEGYDTVEAQEITKEEYHQFKMLNGKTPEEIIDEYTMLLIEGGLL